MKTSILVAFSILCTYVFINILFAHNAYAGDKEFIWDDSGSLIIIENAESSEISFDQNGAMDIKVEPRESGKTFVYGTDQLTIIESTDFGIFAY
jgi:hypothetical protein